MRNESKLTITNKYFFKCNEGELQDSLIEAIKAIETALSEVKIDSYKKSHEKSKGNLFSPVDLNEKIKNSLNAANMHSKRISCNYSNIDMSLQNNVDLIINFFNSILEKHRYTLKSSVFKKEYQDFLDSMTECSMDMLSASGAWKRLTKGYTSHDDQPYPALLLKDGSKYKINDGYIADANLIPYLVSDFVGFREIDFIYESPHGDKVGIEVQFGKYAFMVYNVCAKMKIFERAGLINYGIEIVPSKKMQKFMSTGVSFFEQFVWDLDNRGAFSEDVPVVVLAIEPNKEGFEMLKSDKLTEVSISRSA